MKCKHEEKQQHHARIYCAILTMQIAYSFPYIFHASVNSHRLNIDCFALLICKCYWVVLER